MADSQLVSSSALNVLGGYVYRGEYFADLLLGAYIFGDTTNRYAGLIVGRVSCFINLSCFDILALIYYNLTCVHDCRRRYSHVVQITHHIWMNNIIVQSLSTLPAFLVATSSSSVEPGTSTSPRKKTAEFRSAPSSATRPSQLSLFPKTST